MTEQDLADFYELKKRLIQIKALGHPDFSDLAQRPFILGLDWSKEAIGYSISQVQKCSDGEERRRLIFIRGKNTKHRGDL